MSNLGLLNGEERFFELPTLNLAAKAWGNPRGKPILALHGWLDNAASFDFVAPYLEQYYVLAIDMAGHGHSAHRSRDATYNIWEDITEIMELVEYHRWQHFSLLGHSRGAIMAVILAGTFPQRIDKLALLDGVVPYFNDPQDAPRQLADFVTQHAQLHRRQHRVYASLEDAVAARESGRYPLTHRAAKALMERGLIKVAGGYCWGGDPRLKLPSSLRLSQEHMLAFITGISAPTLLLMADQGLPKVFADIDKFIAAFSRIETHLLKGSHHLHMEEPAPQVAQLLVDFFEANHD